MELDQQLVVGIQLFFAAFLSMVVGLDRERAEKDAGMRTHMLVGTGACLFTSLSELAFPEADTARIASNIVVGIGFLGAGVIHRTDKGVQDLTTAASIWITAAIGMAVGTGAWLLATMATLLVWTILRILLAFRNRI
ncbi:MAG: MgtC/SapB family protein [Chloroflexi bacterium]|nr:MgtC/SapB family protein [Chloroflexota bacterium]